MIFYFIYIYNFLKLYFILIKYKLYIYDVTDLIAVQSLIPSLNYELITFMVRYWFNFKNIGSYHKYKYVYNCVESFLYVPI